MVVGMVQETSTGDALLGHIGIDEAALSVRQGTPKWALDQCCTARLARGTMIDPRASTLGRCEGTDGTTGDTRSRHRYLRRVTHSGVTHSAVIALDPTGAELSCISTFP